MARARQALRSLGAAVRTPADVALAGRILGWSLALPVLKRLLPLPALARLMWRDPVQARRPDRDVRIATLTRLVPRLPTLGLRDNCLERSLVAYRLLAEAGARPRLVVAVGHDGGALQGHVWVTVGGRPIHDGERSLDGFVPTVVFGDVGRREPSVPPAPAADGLR